MRPTPRSATERWAWIRVAAATTLATASLWLTPLSVVSFTVVLLVALSLPRLSPRRKWVAWTSLGLAAAASVTGLTRFALDRAMAGIAEGGQRAAGKSALWRLREVLLAQDGMRKEALWDPDGDGVGSAALIATLAAKQPLRGERPLTRPLLNYRFKEVIPTRLGPAIRVAGHLIIVCLPRAGGGWTARPGDEVDDELAERRWVAYAWPADVGVDVTSTSFIDEHDRILILESPTDRFRGGDRPPPCDAALRTDATLRWKPWKNKQPRQTLPGDR